MPQETTQNELTAPKKLDVNSPETLDYFDKVYKNIEWNDLATSARDFADLLLTVIAREKDLQKRNPKSFATLQDLTIKLKWIALPILTDNEVVEMFEKYLNKSFEIEEFDLPEKLKVTMINHLLLKERDELKIRIREAVARNDERLFDQKITTGNEKRDPTVANWIKDITASMAGNLVDAVKENEYFTKNENIKNLAKEEVAKFRTLFEVYKRCFLSSFSPSGHENPVPVLDKDQKGNVIKGTINQGEFSELKPSEERALEKWWKKVKAIRQKYDKKEAEGLTPQGQKKRLAQAYLGPEEERTKIRQAEAKIKKASQGDLNRIGSVLIESINKGEKHQAAAALRLLAEKTDLVKFLQNNERFYSLAKEYIKINYSDTIQSDFEKKKFSPPYLSAFLQYLFKNKLKMNKEESARLGIQIESLIVKKGAKEMLGMVYGDLEKGHYVWHEVKDVGTRLELPKEV